MKDASHQLDWLVGGASHPKPKEKTRKQNKAEARPQPTLPLKEKRFLPMVGVPPTRGDCPDTSKEGCPFVLCRFHLWRVDACDRAGRPGLASVPRDEHGHTLPVEGDAGEERPGTTLWPAWLELERTCKVVLVRDDDGHIESVDTYEGWEAFREHTHDGEPLEVLNDGKVVGAAELTSEGVKFKGEPSGYVLTLRRVRGVPSCALDEIAKHGRMTNEQIGDAIGRHRTLAAREVRRAAIKVRAEGVDLRDLVEPT
jgi:hypothetical protein